jgi:hypothetical protein
MCERGVDVLGLEKLNSEIFNDVISLAEKTKYTFLGADDFAVKVNRFGKDLYLLKATELCTAENLHLLVFGSSRVTPFMDTKDTIETALADDALVVLDHPFVDNANVRKEISFPKKAYLFDVCSSFSGKIALEWNAYCKPWVRKFIGGEDVNDQLEVFHDRLIDNDIFVPIVADSDVHARNKRLLNAMGTGYVLSYLDDSSGKALVSSLKRKIFSGDYFSNKEFVSFPHFVEAFGVPILFEKYVKNPRG